MEAYKEIIQEKIKILRQHVDLGNYYGRGNLKKGNEMYRVSQRKS